MTKYALVPIADGTEELEATSIITVLRRAGIKVTVLSINQSTNQSTNDPLVIEGARHVKIVADKSINQSTGQAIGQPTSQSIDQSTSQSTNQSTNQSIDPSIFPEQGYFDAIILPGGADGAKNFSECQALTDLLINQSTNHRLIGALCASPATVLSRFKLIKRQAIGHPSTIDTLTDANNQPIYQSINQMMQADPVIYDQSINVITGIGAGQSINFAMMCVQQLVGDEKVNEIKKAMCLYSKL